jgi:hypothetical protein
VPESSGRVQLWEFLFSLLLGKYAEILSAFLGILGAVAFAKAPFESLKSRKALFQIIGLQGFLQGDALGQATAPIVREAEALLKSERLWNIRGAILLFFSFFVLLSHSVYLGVYSDTGDQSACKCIKQ